MQHVYPHQQQYPGEWSQHQHQQHPPHHVTHQKQEKIGLFAAPGAFGARIGRRTDTWTERKLLRPPRLQYSNNTLRAWLAATMATLARRNAHTRSIPYETTDERVIANHNFSFFSTGVQAGLCSWRAALTILNGAAAMRATSTHPNWTDLELRLIDLALPQRAPLCTKSQRQIRNLSSSKWV